MEKYLPGPYTLIFEKKDNDFLPLATASGDTIAVRFLDTKMQELIAKADVPFVTTSANISGDTRILRYLNSLKNQIKEKTDYIVIGNPQKMTFLPSTIIDVRKEKERLVERK
ncbi:MAG: Sua5/YciO/YrdC/YwlC family protein [Candidatus Aenigmarchaeota archaeon]|nr:Sua5/YciO/YrdC/YwlC family protein [Candidatus Aenigmarchaeota archaeon]